MKIHEPCLEAMAMQIIASVALFGTYYIYLTHVHICNRYEACNRKLTIDLCCKSRDRKQKAFSNW